MEYVYFIQAGADGPIKIGIAANPEARLRSLQVANHEELTLLASCPGGIDLELDLHRRFANGRIRGEWFRHDTPGLADTITRARDLGDVDYQSPKQLAAKRELIESRAVVLAKAGRWDEAQELVAGIPPVSEQIL